VKHAAQPSSRFSPSKHEKVNFSRKFRRWKKNVEKIEATNDAFHAVDNSFNVKKERPRVRRMTHLERMFVRSQQSLVVPPAFDEREAASFARGVGQRVHHVLIGEAKRKSNYSPA
jgi:hypothetical protein